MCIRDREYFYPTDVLVTGYDIIFFWVIRMVFSALEQTGKTPFHHVVRYRYYMIAALAFIIFLIYLISLSLGPRKLRIETDNIQIAEVKDDKFMEYVDVEGLVQPILTIKVNTREAGSVDRIVGEEGHEEEKV